MAHLRLRAGLGFSVEDSAWDDVMPRGAAIWSSTPRGRPSMRSKASCPHLMMVELPPKLSMEAHALLMAKQPAPGWVTLPAASVDV